MISLLFLSLEEVGEKRFLLALQPICDRENCPLSPTLMVQPLQKALVMGCHGGGVQPKRPPWLPAWDKLLAEEEMQDMRA